MNWYYVEQGQQAGPLDDAQLEQMRASGRIQDDTLVWHEGMANWQAYREVKGGMTPPPPAGGLRLPAASPARAIAEAPDAVCSQCGNMFPKESMIHYGSNWVCASCKPVFMQKLAEGVTNSPGYRGLVTEADLLARDYDVDIGDSVSKGWETFKANAGLLIGASIITWILLMAVNAVRIIPIPFISVIVSLFVTGPLTAGLWLLYIKVIRGEAAAIGDLFAGFGPGYWQLVLVTLIPMLLTVGVFFVFGLVAALVMPGLIPARHSGISSAPSSAALLPLGLVFLVLFLFFIYISTCWRFALPLVIDKKLKFWPALQLSRGVVIKHWWGTLGLFIICGLLVFGGALACLVGLIVTAPVAFAAMATHYDKVFGDLAPNQT